MVFQELLCNRVYHHLVSPLRNLVSATIAPYATNTRMVCIACSSKNLHRTICNLGGCFGDIVFCERAVKALFIRDLAVDNGLGGLFDHDPHVSNLRSHVSKLRLDMR